MPLNRVNAPSGTQAYVGGVPYKSGQFLPSGTTVYEVHQWYDTNGQERDAGAPGRLVNVAIVAADASASDIIDALDELRSQRLEFHLWRDTDPFSTEPPEDFDVPSDFAPPPPLPPPRPNLVPPPSPGIGL